MKDTISNLVMMEHPSIYIGLNGVKIKSIFMILILIKPAALNYKSDI